MAQPSPQDEVEMLPLTRWSLDQLAYRRQQAAEEEEDLAWRRRQRVRVLLLLSGAHAPTTGMSLYSLLIALRPRHRDVERPAGSLLRDIVEQALADP